MAFRRRSSSDVRVDITPMVDVVFLLLIFFMISTTFVEAPGIDIHLPEAGSEVVEREAEEIKVYLSREGDIFLGDQKTTFADLKTRLDDYGPQAGQMTFMLLADREARHGRVVELMDAARSAGFTRLAIATEDPQGRP
ncbi:biopolymer transport protein ExbD [Geoalkalibacter ferrihydriticus]|uniref:Biopolymer transporter ExbD n=2 Tax=Geoalkalibacter ferrihydriticus TaxID=392333 RepID=A0A0C2HSN9_9BACT|nr:biopolymer transporter ExbD [Geoalkalibacter ferrihydriticus]KIH75782.1 biopolymer transporter ExbD [Geoalkalibacter ferrihydriticus DSM 17813]SDM64802.1 biopolymer transport protein ExbD [Geoalkalibacter ferrihydriticus]